MNKKIHIKRHGRVNIVVDKETEFIVEANGRGRINIISKKPYLDPSKNKWCNDQGKYPCIAKPNWMKKI